MNTCVYVYNIHYIYIHILYLCLYIYNFFKETWLLSLDSVLHGESWIKACICQLLCVYKRCHLVQKAQTKNPECCLQFLYSLPVLGCPPCDPVSCHYSFCCGVVVVFLLISFAYFFLWEQYRPLYLLPDTHYHVIPILSFSSFSSNRDSVIFLTHPGVYLIPLSVPKYHFLILSLPFLSSTVLKDTCDDYCMYKHLRSSLICLVTEAAVNFYFCEREINYTEA